MLALSIRDSLSGMKKAIIAIIIILIVAGGIYFFIRSDNGRSTPDTSSTPTLSATPAKTPVPTPISGTGTIILEVTDKAADMANVTEVQMVLSKTEVHSQAKGWMTVTTEANTFNLLSLHSTGHLQYAGSASISPHTLP